MAIVETREGVGLCGHAVTVTIRKGPDGSCAVEPDLCDACQAYCDSLPAITETIWRQTRLGGAGVLGLLRRQQ